jgi:hypothetical protein
MSNLSNFYRDLKGEPAQDIMDMSKTQKYPIGCRYHENATGRTFIYSKAGAVALVCGDLVQSATLGGALTTLSAWLSCSSAGWGFGCLYYSGYFFDNCTA